MNSEFVKAKAIIIGHHPIAEDNDGTLSTFLFFLLFPTCTCISFCGQKFRSYCTSSLSSLKGLGSQTGFFGPVFCQKKYITTCSLTSYFFLLFEHLCVSDMQKYPAQK